VFIASALNEDERSASRPGHFTPGERAPATNLMGHFVGSRGDLESVEEKGISNL
jgi:hypothetical protein